MARETREQRHARYLREKSRAGGVPPTTARRRDRERRGVAPEWRRYGYPSERTMQRRRAEGRPSPKDQGAAWRRGVGGRPVIMWRPNDPASRRAAQRALDKSRRRSS